MLDLRSRLCYLKGAGKTSVPFISKTEFLTMAQIQKCGFRRRRPPIPISSRPPFQSDGGQARSSSQVDFAHVMVRQSGSSRGAQFAQAFPLELDAMGGVDNAVKDRFGQGGVTHDFIPTTNWHLAGDDQRAGVVAILDDLQQVATLFGR